MALIMGMIIAMGHVSVPLVLIMGALRSVGQAFHMPAMESTMPLLVPKKHVVRVNTMNQSLWSMALVVGPVLGIFLYTVVGFQMVLFLNAAAAPLRAWLSRLRRSPISTTIPTRRAIPSQA